MFSWFAAPPPDDAERQFADQAPPTWPAYARQVIHAALANTDPHRIPIPADADRKHHGAFVTLRNAGKLRGCIGTLDPTLPLDEAVADAARSAATCDTRFTPVRRDEVDDLSIEVSILSDPVRMQSLDDLELGVHGIVVRRGNRRGLFLPKVATDHHMDRETFLGRCCSEKAGLAPDAWREPETDVLLFTTELFCDR